MSLDIFKNYDLAFEKGKPDINNEREKINIEKEYWNEIVRGAENSYSYILDLPNKHDTTEDIEKVIITYRQGTKTILDDIDYSIKGFKSGLINSFSYVRVKWEINSSQSLLFNSFNKNVFGQVKVIYSDGSIYYSPLLKHLVIENLNEGVSND